MLPAFPLVVSEVCELVTLLATTKQLTEDWLVSADSSGRVRSHHDESCGSVGGWSGAKYRSGCCPDE